MTLGIMISSRPNVQMVQNQEYPKNQFLKDLESNSTQDTYSQLLSSSVNLWSDFNSITYNPDSIFELPSHSHNDPNNQFALYTTGKAAFKDMSDTLMDERVRRFMEESDSAQGFQIFADVETGFSGLASSAIESISEEYPKKSIFVYGIHSASDNLESIVVDVDPGKGQN
jgi:hypothetical protein